MALVGFAGSIIWITAAAVGAGHGLDFSDEGFYLLSYRWWNDELRTFTGAQYFYGPVFQLLGYDVHLLRLFRLASIVVAVTAVAVAAARWLDAARPAEPDRRHRRRAAVVGAVLAGGGLEYTWLPLSPGYNDVALVGSLLLGAITIEICTRTVARRPIPWWLGATAGAVFAVMMLSKWSSAVVCAAAVAVVWIVVIRPWRTLARVCACALAGMAALLIALQLAVVDLSEAVPLLVETNGEVGQRSNSVAGLLSLYRTNTWANLRLGVERYPLLLLAPLAAFAFPALVRRRRFVLPIVCAGATVFSAVRNRAIEGGTVNLSTSLPLVTVLAAFPVLTSVLWSVRLLVARRAGRRRSPVTGDPTGGSATATTVANDRVAWVAVVAVLVLLPFCQAAGTGNPILFVALHGGACWIAAALVLASARTVGELSLDSGLVVVAAVTAALAVSLGTSGSLDYPYRAGGSVSESSQRPSNASAVGSLRLAPAIASELDRLSLELQDWIDPPGRRILAFDEAAGLVFAFEGRSVGESWYSGSDVLRTARTIRSACPGGVPPWGERRPLVLFRSPVVAETLRPELIDAMKDCGLLFREEYVRLASSPQLGLVVFGPR